MELPWKTKRIGVTDPGFLATAILELVAPDKTTLGQKEIAVLENAITIIAVMIREYVSPEVLEASNIAIVKAFKENCPGNPFKTNEEIIKFCLLPPEDQSQFMEKNL